MLENLTNPEDRKDADARLRDRESLIRERMETRGLNEEEARRLVLSEEELSVGKRDVEAGEAFIGKHVETEHVREDVGLRREEAVIERRPITDGMSAAGATISEDGEEIRIPLHAEEAVVEKRVVPKEELVVRKRDVVEHETVEADLRRERADVRSEGQVNLHPDRSRDDLRDR
jgi:uncharacterized protein (TIGR02271 family)